MTDAYGSKTADYIAELEKSKNKDIAKVARELVDASKFVSAKGESAKQLVEDAADALDLFTLAVHQGNTVAEQLTQKRLDTADYSGKAKDYALDMEAGKFASRFRNDLSEAKTQTVTPDFEPLDEVLTRDGKRFQILSIKGDKADLYSEAGVPLKTLRFADTSALQMVAPNRQIEGEINLENLYYKQGEFDYEQVKNVAARVGSGELGVTRLKPREEQGRIASGRRNVEASIIIGADASANKAASRGRRPTRKEKLQHNARVRKHHGKR